MGTPATVSGARLTSTILSARRITNMAPKIRLLFDDKKALMTMSGEVSTRDTDNPQFFFMLDEIIPDKGTTGASAASVSAASVSAALDLSGVTTAVYLQVDDVIKFPANGMICRVSATPTNMNSVAVLQNVAANLAASAATAAAGATWVKIGNAKIENSRLYDSSNNLNSIAVTETTATNYTQTFRTTFGMSRRELKSNLYGGADRPHQRMKKLLEHCWEIENAMWHGVSAAESSRTYTQGLLTYIPSGNQEAIPTLTEEEFDDFVRRITRYGNAKKRTLFCSRYVGQLLSQWAAGNQRITSLGSSIKYGVHVNTLMTGVGCEIDVVATHSLEGLPGSTAVGTWDGYAALVDMEDVQKVRFMGDEAKLATDVQFKDQDGVADAFLSDVGLDPGNYNKHGLITGITA